MSKKAIGYITMNAGDGIPGSILKWALKTYAPRFDYSIVVDGNLTPEAKAFYDTIPNLIAVDSPWTGRHVDQYWKRNAEVQEGDWLLAFDDDEFPSEPLMNLLPFLDKLPSELNIFYTPSLTYLAVDSTDNFWRVQEQPNQEDYLRRAKRILYKKNSRTNYFIHSPCGMHVTPTHVMGSQSVEVPGGDHRPFWYHIKTLESFIYNECVYNISNPRHESGPAARQMTMEQEVEFERLVTAYDLQNIPHFLDITKNHEWPDEFKNFVYQFKDLHGLAMCKFYYLYEYVSKGDFSDTIELLKCISKGFIPVYEDVVKNNEKPLVIPRTKSIWM